LGGLPQCSLLWAVLGFHVGTSVTLGEIPLQTSFKKPPLCSCTVALRCGMCNPPPSPHRRPSRLCSVIAFASRALSGEASSLSPSLRGGNTSPLLLSLRVTFLHRECSGRGGLGPTCWALCGGLGGLQSLSWTLLELLGRK
jgi:hypothetical protein